MHPPSIAALLDAWERGLACSPLERMLGLLAAAFPGTPRDELADLGIGRRDAALLRLRAQAFGPRLQARASCVACGEALELELAVSELLVEHDSAPAPAIELELDGYEVVVRLPSTRDLASLRDQPAADARRALFERCVVRARQHGRDIEAAALPEAMVDAAAGRMAEADPQADVRFDLCCAACGHRWQADFDIAAFLWAELDAWAQRLLGEVHALASAYGWSEAEILGLSPWRRHCYLEMVATP